MAEGQRSGLSRRRVLQGTAWSVPAVLIATAVPARATSLEDENAGVIFNSLTSYRNPGFWVAPDGPSIHVVMTQAQMQNVPGPAGGDGSDLPAILFLELRLEVPIGTVEGIPLWGVGYSSAGVPDDGPYEVVGDPSVTDGLWTVTVRYTPADPIPAYNPTVQIPIWVQSQVGATGTVIGTVTATHTTLETSTDTLPANIAMLGDGDAWKAWFNPPYADPPLVHDGLTVAPLPAPW